MTTERTVYQYARVDRWGQVVTRVHSTTPVEVGQVQTIGKRETVLVACDAETAERMQQDPARFCYDADTKEWRERIPVRFSSATDRAIADDQDEAAFMLVGVPKEIRRVRLELDRKELWLPRDEDADGTLILRLRSSRPGFSRVALQDARLYADESAHVVRFVDKPLVQGGIENAG